MKMKYAELEKYAAWATGVAFAAVTIAVEIAMKMGPIEMMFSAGCMMVIGPGIFLQIVDLIEQKRLRKARKAHKRKQVDFVVGKPVPGMPGYYEVDL